MGQYADIPDRSTGSNPHMRADRFSRILAIHSHAGLSAELLRYAGDRFAYLLNLAGHIYRYRRVV